MESCESSGRDAKLLRLEKGKPDHVCDFYPSYQYDSVMECSDSLLFVLYKCGACDRDFSTICALHNHLQDHVAGGSYHYDHVCRTAFPKFDTCCAYTQTELVIGESRNLETIDRQELDVEAFQNVDKNTKKARTGPKVSRNIVNRKKKLHNPTQLSDVLSIADIMTGSNGTKCIDRSSAMERNGGILTDQVWDQLHDDYNDDTDVESDLIELKNVTMKDDLESETDKMVAAIYSGLEGKNRNAIDETKLDKLVSDNSLGDKNAGSFFEASECGSHKKCHVNSPKTKSPKNKRKMIHPRKVMKHDGKCNFKNKPVFKSKKNFSQAMMQIHMKQGFAQVIKETVRAECRQNNINDMNADNDRNQRKPLKSKQFQCSMCHETMSSYMIKRHKCIKGFMENEENGKSSKRITCEFCGFSYIRSEYARHMRSHTGERPFICEKCGKDFARIKYLKKHLITHEEVKPFICSLCGAGFCQNKEYKQHMCSHTGVRDYMCNVCDATFICKASLLTHVQNIHLGETRFECDVCHRRFFKRSSLNLHRATHFEAALSCKYCSKKFKDSTGIKRHEKIHTGVKNFRCHLCDHAFVQSTPFWSHMEKRHGLSKDEAKKKHKENVKKAKVMQHVLKKQEEEDQSSISEAVAKPMSVLQQPLPYSTATAAADGFESMNTDYDQMTCNSNEAKSAEYTHQILTNVSPSVPFSQVNLISDNTIYSPTVNLSKYISVPQTVQFDTLKSDFSDYTHTEVNSTPEKVQKTIEQGDSALSTSSQYQNSTEGLEKVQQDFKGFDRYHYGILKPGEKYSDLYDPMNCEKVHDLSKSEQKGFKVAENRNEEILDKTRNISPQEPYTGYVKVPDPSLYAWNKKTGHFKKMADTEAKVHTVSVADQYRLLEKGTEELGVKLPDLLSTDRPQDLTSLGMAAYQSYLTSAQGQSYFDKEILQMQFEKECGSFMDSERASKDST